MGLPSAVESHVRPLLDRALRVEKPTLSAGQSRVDVHVDIGDRLEAARKRVMQLESPEGRMRVIENEIADS